MKLPFVDSIAIYSKISVTMNSSAHLAGLIHDPFVQYFLPPTRLHDRPAKDPLINRGTFLRISSIDNALTLILNDGVPTQVLSLGAGFDTRFFNFRVTKPILFVSLIYIEIFKYPKVR